MKLFIDFDDVLFNTRNFTKDIKILFLKHGIPENIFNETYKNANRFSGKIDKRMRTYDPSFQFKKIRDKIKINTLCNTITSLESDNDYLKKSKLLELKNIGIIEKTKKLEINKIIKLEEYKVKYEEEKTKQLELQIQLFKLTGKII